MAAKPSIKVSALMDIEAVSRSGPEEIEERWALHSSEGQVTARVKAL
jgi:hypothetical protein